MSMLVVLSGLILIFITAVSAALIRVFALIPRSELKRNARSGDDIAVAMYKAAAYGAKTTGLLWFVTIVSAYIGLQLLNSAWGNTKTAGFAVIVLIITARLINGKEGISRGSLWLSRRISPLIAWAVERLHPILEKTNNLFRKVYPVRVHSGLYDKDDLLELLNRQKNQPDNRISKGEIELISHALTFGDQTVADALVPKRVVISVPESDNIGPFLMDRLHKSGHSRFPVFSGNKNNVTGVLYLHDLLNTSAGGEVSSIMRRKVTYVHENFTLYQTLQAFIKTKQHLFVVVNDFEEYVGIITIEDVIERVIGKLIVDEFDQYDDLRAVAAAAAKKDHNKTDKIHAESQTEETEVV